jgi:hypothetical protein
MTLKNADKFYEKNKRISERANLDFNMASHLDATTKTRMN